MLLLDTNVVSELRKLPHGRVDPNFAKWVRSAPDEDFYLSSVTVFELTLGVLRAERRDAVKGSMLRSWLEERVLPDFIGRVLSVDVRVAQRCASLQVPTTRPDRDSLIAATALVHGMTVVTRNVRHFEPMCAAVLNPWD